ncbi:TetR family transcriptional regulator [Williamsia muralis]|uniref:TetR family transcriptional regulator n=1 Tax=Williamsia marianensis TaxID=85044 RepID=A0A2G3PS23_WILMA|nr:TetR family transcriptional regulator [Williamsia marianensis]PHV68649.1 TetR family transcriptional regulator [Williamsia marianensis]
MAPTDVTATKQRILDAARDEFAVHGLAGARIDRIASNASASKERLYAYFGDKVALFHAILDADFDRFLDAVPFDAEDVPAYVVALFDDLVARPQTQRLLLWGQLEGRAPRLRELATSDPRWRIRIDAIGTAQQAGQIEPHWDPEEVLTVIFGLVSSWVTTPGSDGHTDVSPAVVDHRRSIVRESARRIFSPAPS